MFIAFLVIAVLGIFAGALIFFYGTALFNTYVSSAKKLIEEQKASNVESNDGSADADGGSQDAQVDENQTSESDEMENSELNSHENVEARKKLFSPLPYLMIIEGVILFVFNAVMFALKFYFPKMMEFYVLLPISIGFILLSILVDALVLSFGKGDNSETNFENNIDKTE